MKINIYDTELNRVRYLDKNFISCLWKENYNSQGTFSLEVAATELTKTIFKPDYYIGRTDRKSLMVIKSVTVADDKITATGKTAERQLEDVAFIGTIAENSIITEAVKNAFNQSNKYKCFAIPKSNITAKYGRQISNKSIYELLSIMCGGADLGYRAVKNGKSIDIEFYQPEVNKNLRFSESYGNIKDLSLTLSTQSYKNFAVVLGEGEGVERRVLNVDVRADDNEQRRELIVDAKDLQKTEEETEQEYFERLAARGVEKLIDCMAIKDVDFTPLAVDFGKDFDLGDIIIVLLKDFNIILQARVVSFQEKEQNNKTELSIDVGEVLPIAAVEGE